MIFEFGEDIFTLKGPMLGYPAKLGYFVKSGTCKEHYFGYLTTANCPAILDFKKYGFDGRRLKPYTKKELKEIISQFILI